MILNPSPPPSEVARGPHHRQDGGPQVSVILGISPFHQSSLFTTYVELFITLRYPPARVHRIIPLHAQDPNPCDQVLVFSRAPLGARSCHFALPHVPWGSAEALRRAISYRGDTRGGATSHGVEPDIHFSTDYLSSRRGTPLPTSKGQTDGYTHILTDFQTVPASGFTPRRLRRQVISPFHASRSRPGAPSWPWSSR